MVCSETTAKKARNILKIPCCLLYLYACLSLVLVFHVLQSSSPEEDLRSQVSQWMCEPLTSIEELEEVLLSLLYTFLYGDCALLSLGDEL